MDFVTVENVPLVKVGTWKASSGEQPVTQEDLAAIVEAHESGLLDKGVIKKGHLDPRHNNPAWDGDPVYGQADNLRLSEDGNTVIGDYVNVPKALAESLPSAYPNRSVEIAWGVQLKDAAGKVSKKFRAALAGVALLGSTPPAVKGLGGPVATFSGSVECENMNVFSSTTEADETTDFAFPGGLTGNTLRETLDSAVNAAYKRTRSALDGEEVESMYPWLVDYTDTEAIFRAGGKTYQVGYTIAGGAVALDETPVAVTEQKTYVPISDTPAIPQTNLSEKQASNGTGTQSAVESNTQEGGTMSEFLLKLRDKLKLPETATEEEILTAAAEAVPAAEAEPAEGEKPEGGTVEVDAETAASEKLETVVVSKASFSELVANAATDREKLAKLEKLENTRRIDGIVSTFSAAGKIHPSEEKQIRNLLESNEDATVALLSERAGIPVTAIGRDDAEPVAFSQGGTFDGAMSAFGFGANN